MIYLLYNTSNLYNMDCYICIIIMKVELSYCDSS